MSRPTRATPRFAEGSSSRIDLVPSRRAALACLVWLALACAITMCAALPTFVRLSICALVATSGTRTLRSFVLLRGSHAVRAIDWTGSVLTIRLGPLRVPVVATLSSTSFRAGRQWLALAFETPEGGRRVLVDGRYQDARAFRRLCREFSRGLEGSARRDSRTS